MGEVWGSWKGSIKEIFLLESLGSEALAGLTVAAAALPLNIALAVACKLPPSAGLVAGAIGGAIAAVFGGSTRQVSGPAAALNLMVLGIVPCSFSWGLR
ncbi:MAG: hypothetical protein HYR96_05610 [Deltaproteobacteria bacterium]|nr:hypothetical protein [Deltaproteobacteria bacterium]